MIPDERHRIAARAEKSHRNWIAEISAGTGTGEVSDLESLKEEAFEILLKLRVPCPDCSTCSPIAPIGHYNECEAVARWKERYWAAVLQANHD